jgi:acyl-CoA synthetase (AMP-forming)/AMP-acid ligase II
MSVVYVDFFRSAQSIGQLLQMRAQSYPHVVAVRSFKEDNTASGTIDYATLHRRAKTIAVKLQQIVPTGARAVLMYDCDIDYVSALFACFYSGITAIPILPVKNKKERKRLEDIIIQSKACLFLTNQTGIDGLDKNFWTTAAAENVWPVVTHFEKVSASTQGFHDRSIDPEMIAIMDYSYTTEKNVTPHSVTHQELLEKALNSANQFNSVVSWLTPFPGKGSIVGLFTPAAEGVVTEFKMVR